MRKRVVGLLIGFVYAVVYAFWALFATNGGHGNFIWLVLFGAAEMVGLFFPIMGFLAADLRSFASKTIFGGLLIANFLITAIVLYGNLGGVNADIPRTWARTPYYFLICAGIHAAPLCFLMGVLIKSILIGEDMDADRPASIIAADHE